MTQSPFIAVFDLHITLCVAEFLLPVEENTIIVLFDTKSKVGWLNVCIDIIGDCQLFIEVLELKIVG